MMKIQQTDKIRAVRHTPSNIGAEHTKKGKFRAPSLQHQHNNGAIGQACEGCRRLKTRCDAATINTWPCGRCASRKLQCVPPTLNNSKAYTSGRCHPSIDRVLDSNNFSGGSDDEVNSREPHAPHAPYAGSLGSSCPSYTRSQSSSQSSDIDPLDRATSAASDPPASSRKRPRGAAEDCFTCTDLHIDCDRERPYCTQCMVGGKKCPGYKTTLTWGLGIASRGKLRGLSSPVLNSKNISPTETESTSRKTHVSKELSSSVPCLSIAQPGRLEHLIEHYKKFICFYIVAFDGPTNSFCTDLLRLASESNTLQYAIAALSLSNLRVRMDHRSSVAAHDKKTHPTVPSKEEIYYKVLSTRELKAQLQDPSRRKDDCVPATILMQCFYNICNSSVNTYQTLFVGTKVFCALKDTMSNKSAWLTTTFSWFDAITATVNDRESQLQNSTSTSSTSEWALENLAGCDRRLFSTIAKLGRLNLLSQGKSVSSCLNTMPNLSSTSPHSEFWPEWQFINSALRSWSLDATILTPSFHFDPTTSSDLNRVKLLHISEVFRYAALLYTERLAYASLPSSAANFQYLALQGLHHIEQVNPSVHLLWPLFITGTECVEEEHRELIRGRCLSIQRDSGFFNITLVLKLLERVWRKSDTETDAEQLEGKGFRWRSMAEDLITI